MCNLPYRWGSRTLQNFEITGESKMEEFLGMVVEQADKCIKIYLDNYVKEVIAE